MITIVNRIVRWRLHKLTFPQLPKIKYNRLWETSNWTFRNIKLLEFFKIFKSLIIDNYNLSSILTLSTIALIIKRSGILEEKDTDTHLKMFKALEVKPNNVSLFLKCSLIFSLIWRIISFTFSLFWIPLKLAIVFYVLDYLNYDVSYIYYKLNNLSLGVLDWYYRTLIDFLETLRFKTYFNQLK